jgi:hypothetical protein
MNCGTIASITDSAVGNDFSLPDDPPPSQLNITSEI